MARQKFSGITTAEDLKSRCRINELTDCWHWRGASSTDKAGRKCQRVWVYDSVRGEFRTMSGPMAVLEVTGRRTANTEMGWRRCRCEDCMNPQHVDGGTRRQWGNWVRNTGAWKNCSAHAVSIIKARESRMKLTQQIVDEMRASGRSAVALAAEHGIAENYARDVLAYRAWNTSPLLPGASVFSLAKIQ
jgi:hypothetical protein